LTLRVVGRQAVPRVKACAVAASMAGVRAPGEAACGRQRKHYAQDDLRRKDTW